MEELLAEAATQETQDPFLSLLSLSQEERNSIMDACYKAGCAPAVAGILEMVRLGVEVDSSVLIAENMTSIEKVIRSHMDNSEDKKQTMDSIVAGQDALNRIFEGYCTTMKTLVEMVNQTSGSICKDEASKSSIGAGKGSCAEGGGMASGGSASKSSYEDVGDVAADDEDSCKNDSVVSDVGDGGDGEGICLHHEAIESPPPHDLSKTTMEELLSEAATQETQDPFVSLMCLSQEERNSIMDACYEAGCAPAVAGILEMVRLEVEVDSSVLLAENMTSIEKAM